MYVDHKRYTALPSLDPNLRTIWSLCSIEVTRANAMLGAIRGFLRIGRQNFESSADRYLLRGCYNGQTVYHQRATRFFQAKQS